MNYINRFHKSWTSLFFVGCLSLFLGFATNHSVRAEIFTATFDDIDDELTWEGRKTAPFRLSADIVQGGYSYLGLNWTRVGIIKPNTYLDTYKGSRTGYTSLIHRDGNVEGTHVAYNDAGKHPITISIPTAKETGAFQFLGGFFQLAHFLTGEIKISGLTVNGDEVIETFEIGYGDGEYTDISLLDNTRWNDEWFVLLRIESLGDTFEGNRNTSDTDSKQFVCDSLQFDIDWTKEYAPGLLFMFNEDGGSTTPEPASLLLFACGSLGLLAYRRRKA